MKLSFFSSGVAKSLVSGAVIRGGNVTLTLLTSVFLARLLGPQGMGVYALALSVVAMAGLPVQFGVPVIVLRETAWAAELKKWDLIRGLWVWATRKVILTSVVILPVLAIAGWFLEGILFPEGTFIVLLAALPLVPLFALAQLRGSALRGLKFTTLGQLPDALIRPIVFLLLLLLASLTFNPIRPLYAISSLLASAAITYLIGGILINRSKPKDLIKVKPNFSKRKGWGKAILPLAFVSGVSIAMQNINIIFLGIWGAPEDVGFFRIAVSAAGMALFGLSVVNMIFAPSFARLNAGLDLKEMELRAQQAAGLAFLAALLIAALLWFAGPFVISLLYGHQYLEAYLPLAILVGAQVISSFYGSCGNVLNMTGRERFSFRAMALALVVNITFNVFLIPDFGVVGAASATVASTLAWNLVMDFYVRRELGFTCSALGILERKCWPR